MSSEQANAKRDVVQERLIANSRQLRDQLADVATELERYVRALQAEVARLQNKG